MKTAEFEVDVTTDDALCFANLSGDWNPLHTDPDYAKGTDYKRPILHGAFSAAFFSRMAGMILPGRDCLLYGLKLKFVAPIIPPASLRVHGQILRDNGHDGLVQVTVGDALNGTLYVTGTYEFGRHRQADVLRPTLSTDAVNEKSLVLVTGATGGVGNSLLDLLGDRGIGVSRSRASGKSTVNRIEQLKDLLVGRKLAAIVHCGWPSPDNAPLATLGGATHVAVRHNVADPLTDSINLAQTLVEHGQPGAMLMLIGSTSANPGRHNWRAPLYSLAKSLLPTLVSILATELSSRDQRCVGVVFDVIDGGMNSGMRESVRLAHADRSPSGVIPTPRDIVDQIDWILKNSSTLVSGATINLTGGAAP